MVFFPSQGMMFRYIWDFKKMRIFKNKIIFLYFFWGLCGLGVSSKSHRFHGFTQIFSSTISYPQMRPIRSNLHRFSRLHWSPFGKRFFRIPPSPFSQRELHLSSRSSPLREEEENRPTRCSNRYAIRLADRQRSRQIMRDGTAWGGMASYEYFIAALPMMTKWFSFPS